MGWLIDDTQTIFHEARDSFSIVVNFDQSGFRSMTESEAVAAAVAANSARLKELRLARDAAQQAAPAIPVKKAGKKNSKQNGKKNRPAASLSDWLKNRQAAGHSH
jgi:hypothetical protein